MKLISILKSPKVIGSSSVLLLIVLAGCNRSDTTAPVAAAPAPAPAAAAAPAPAPTTEADMYVDAAPPPPQSEVMTASPGPGFVWVGGYWGFQAGRHDWVRGHWERPPHERAQWVQPRWERRGKGYVFVRGFWR